MSYTCPTQAPFADITWNGPHCQSCNVPSLAYVEQDVIGQAGVCVFQVPSNIAAVVVTDNSICQVGTTDTIKGTSGQQTASFDIADNILADADAVICSLTRPTDGKVAYVVDGGGLAVGSSICQQLIDIGWVES